MDLLPNSNSTDSVSCGLGSNVAAQSLPSSPSIRKNLYTPPSLQTTVGEAGEPPFPRVSIIDNEVAVDIPQEGVALVLDSTCLPFILKKGVKEIFLKLARICSSVICCRVTPSQKVGWQIV